jgi:uncharacterized protein (TIGR03118 family)
MWGIALTCACAVSSPAQALGPVSVQNLVTDDQSVNSAQITDKDLVNPWGVSYTGTGPFWVSDNGTGKSTFYTVNPGTNATSKLTLPPPLSINAVQIPGAGNVTGQVFNSSSQFNSNLFLFVSEDGTVSGWRPALGANAETLVPANTNNVYKGVTLSTVGTNRYLYAANFKAGTIDVFKGNSGAPNLTGNLTDPNLPSGFAPFNVENIDNQIYVTYAKQDADKEDDVAGAGNGFVDKFNQQGQFLARVASGNPADPSKGDPLNSPWGMVIAPSSFGALAGDLLIGNFGDGTIDVFDKNNHFLGKLTKGDGNEVEIEGLWALIAGNDSLAGSTQSIFFTAGPGEEAHGLFGVLAVPEPSSVALLSIGLSGLLVFRSRSRSHCVRV